MRDAASKKKKPADSTVAKKDMPEDWTFPEALLFEKFGMPEGEDNCLAVLKSTLVSSGPTPRAVDPNSISKAARHAMGLGEQNTAAAKRAERDAREEQMLLSTGLALANNNLLAAHSAERTRLSYIVKLERDADPNSDEYRQALENFRTFLKTPCKQLTEAEFLPVKKSRPADAVVKAPEVVTENCMNTSSITSASSDTSDTQFSDSIMPTHDNTTTIADYVDV